MAVAMQPLVNQAGVVLMSPTVTTNSLSGQDDFFFRMTVPLTINAAKTAAYALANGMTRVAVSVDIGNAAYTEDWFESFRGPFERDGGKIIHVERFKSGAEGGFLPLAERLLKERPDALLLLSGAMDTAMIAQQVRKLDNPATLLASEWAFTSDVINFGGAAVEGMLSYVTYDPASPTPKHQLFLTNFEKRFGYKPSFAAVLGYEAAITLFAGLERKPRREGLKEALLQVGTFAGLQGEVQINRHGDPERTTYLGIIRQGRFATIE
jgi:branched-chain amino acid transport system substrate-binding protein